MEVEQRMRRGEKEEGGVSKGERRKRNRREGDGREKKEEGKRR